MNDTNANNIETPAFNFDENEVGANTSSWLLSATLERKKQLDKKNSQSTQTSNLNQGGQSNVI